MRICVAACCVLFLTIAGVGGCSSGDAVPAYDVTVTFNDRYTDALGVEVTAMIREFDPDADVRIQESFPPIARATVRTRREDVCEQLLRSLVGRADIGNLNCQPLDRGSPTP